jgi:hypothetical protein
MITDTILACLFLAIPFGLSYLLFGRGNFSTRRVGYFRQPEWIDALGFIIGFGMILFVILAKLVEYFN